MATDADDQPRSWACDACTFMNSRYLPRCEVCETPRAKVQKAAANRDDVTAASSRHRGLPSPQHGRRAGLEPALSRAELAAFARDGFVILRGVVSPRECQRLLWERVAPALNRSGICPFDEATWGGEEGTVIKGFDGGDHPIPLSCPDSRWPALFHSPILLAVLDQLHGGHLSGGLPRWEWACGAAEGLGWIHVRFPIHSGPCWLPPDEGWHIDGGANVEIDGRPSIVALPLLTTIRPGGGGTALLRGSHRRVAALLREAKTVRPTTMAKTELRTRGARAVVEATGSAGDVLLMHPLLIHSASNAHRATKTADGTWTRHGLRITFNLATQWRHGPRLSRTGHERDEQLSPLEESLIGARPIVNAWLQQHPVVGQLQVAQSTQTMGAALSGSGPSCSIGDLEDRGSSTKPTSNACRGL